MLETLFVQLMISTSNLFHSPKLLIFCDQEKVDSVCCDSRTCLLCVSLAVSTHSTLTSQASLLNIILFIGNQGEKVVTPPPQSKRREHISAPKFFNENAINGTHMEEISPIKPAPQSRPAKSPKALKSPSMHRQPLTPRQKTRPVISEQPSNFEMVRSPITPSAVKMISQQSMTPIHHNQRDMDDSFQIPDPILNEVQEVGAVIGKKAAEFAFIASESLAGHAQTALSHAAEVVPRYSVQDMNRVVHKKNELLAELTRSVLLLRQEEEKRAALERQVENLHDLKRENDELNDALAHKDSILEDYTLRMKSLETELAVLRNESKQDQQLLKANKSTVDSLKTHNSELMQLIQSLQSEKQKMAEENHHLIKSLEQTEAKFHSQERSLMETIVNLREKANLSISEKNSEVNALRSHLDTAQSKWEVHQAEISQQMQQLEEQRQAVEAELNKTKSQSAQTIESLQDLLQSREHDLQSANVTITELRSKLATTDITHNHLKSEYESCNALLSKAQSSLLEYQGEYQKVEKAYNERTSECDELRHQLATITEDLRLAQDVTKDLKREQEYFNDKIRLMELTITAQSNEIETLQKDLTRVEKAKEMMEQGASKQAVAYAQRVAALQSQCVALRSEFEGVCATSRAESTAVATMVSSVLTEGKDALHSLLTTVESKDGEIARLSQSVRSLQEKEATLVLELERQVQEHETTSRIHTEEKEALQHLLIAAQERKTSVENTLSAVQEALQGMQEKYQQARQDNKAKDDDIASLRRQVTAFDQLVNTLKESAREEIYSQKEQLESTIEIYIGQLKMHEAEMSVQAAKLREAQEEVHRLREQVSTKEQEAQQLHGMVDALKGSLQEEMEQKRQLQSEMDAYVASKTSEWTAVEETLSRELQQCKDKCEELEAVRCLLEEQLQVQKDDYASALATKDAELQTLQTQLAALQATATAKAQEAEGLQLDLAATRSAFAELRLERESSELKTMMHKTDLETKLSEARTALQHAKDENKMLSAELEVCLLMLRHLTYTTMH